MIARPRRSVLYMPGSNAKALAKAASLPADALILDLEDSVSPDAKEAARAQVVAAVKGSFGSREVIIRVNGQHTPWGPDDLIAAAKAGPDAILLPKVDGPGGIMHAARVMRDAGAPDRTRIWAMLETPNAILSAGQIAAVAADSASRLAVLVMGLNDLAKETRARLTPGRPTMTAWLANCVVAARAHEIEIIDGVYNDIKDLDGFRAECQQGLDFGFDGKTLIHPSQIDICNETSSRRRHCRGRARRKAILAAFEQAGKRTAKACCRSTARWWSCLHAANGANAPLPSPIAIDDDRSGGGLTRQLKSFERFAP